MGYYMRYIVADDRPVTVADIEAAFAASGPGYSFDVGDDEVTIEHQGEPVGHVTLNVPGDGLFEDELEELVEFAEEGEGAGRKRVLETLRAAKGIVAVQVLFGGGDGDEALDALEPIWSWLAANRRGLMQADGEGYYDGTTPILELE